MEKQYHSEFPIEEFRVSKMCYFTFVMKQEEPCEGRLSYTVLWERRGVTPLRDPTIDNQIDHRHYVLRHEAIYFVIPVLHMCNSYGDINSWVRSLRCCRILGI